MKAYPKSLVVCAAILATSAAFGGQDSLVTAVYSKVNNGYQRQRLPDGSFKREYYALANGVYLPGIGQDRSIDGVRYPQIAKLVSQFLALENYYLAQDAKSADLLLTITWGTTVPFDDSLDRASMDAFFASANSFTAANAVLAESEKSGVAQRSPDGIQSPAASVRDAARNAFEGQLLQLVMSNDVRRRASEHNARLLGYVDEINRRENPSKFGGAGDAFWDLVSDIENERYFVIVAAYDFRGAVRGDQPKLLWSTRVSVQAQGNRFNEVLAAMLRRASPYFGENSRRLVRRYEPDANFTFGDLKFVGFEPGAESAEKSDGAKP